MGYWEYFSKSWYIFKTNWATFLIVAIIPTFLRSCVELIRRAELNPLVIVIIYIAYAIVFIFSTIAYTTVAHKATDGQVITVSDAYKLSQGLFFKFIWTTILYFLICFGGIILFIIPGIIWALRYVFSPTIVIVEGISGREALSMSKSVTKKRWAQIFVRELVFGVLFFIFVWIPQNLLIFCISIALGAPVIGFSGSTPLWAEAIQTLGKVLHQAFMGICNVLLYKSIRLMDKSQKEEDKALKESHTERNLNSF